jgi:hypothetical protein
MSFEGCIAELTVYRVHQGSFKDPQGRVLADWPPVLEELHAYWLSRCRGRAFPARADIDPIDIPSLLEHLLLVDVLRDPLDFRYRLVGGHIVTHAGSIAPGRTTRGLIEDGHSAERAVQEKVMLAWQAVAQSLAPVAVELTCHAAVSEHRKRLQGVLLPLGPTAEDINMLLGGISFLE